MKLVAISNDNRRGFTFIEILLVLGIVLVLALAAVPIYGNFFTSTQIDEVSGELIQTLRTARERSAARFHGASHGVHFEINNPGGDAYILYEGDSWASRITANDRRVDLESVFSLSTTLAGNDVIFSKGLALPSSFGTVSIASESGDTHIIAINAQGMVEK